MKPEEQRAAIAKACGWTCISITPYTDGPHGCPPRAKVGDPGMEVLPPLPDYLNDLNAMFDAEKSLQHFGFYHDTLAAVMGEPRNGIMLIRATAAQRAEAFLKTVGKWIEEETAL